jgi:hypothetical protein
MLHPLLPGQDTVGCHSFLDGIKVWKHTNVLSGTENDIGKVTDRGRIRGGKESANGLSGQNEFQAGCAQGP